jgi:hypothetical protein
MSRFRKREGGTMKHLNIIIEASDDREFKKIKAVLKALSELSGAFFSMEIDEY